MPSVINSFHSTEFCPPDLPQFENFVVTRFNPLVNHETGVILNGNAYLSGKTGRPMTAKKAAALLWAQRADLPMNVRWGRHDGSVYPGRVLNCVKNLRNN